MNIPKIYQCVRHGIAAFIAMYATGQVWKGMGKFTEGFQKLDDPNAGGLNTGLMLILVLLIIYMCLFAARHILQIVFIIKKPEDGQFMDGNEDKLINYIEKALYFLRFAPAVVIWLLLMAMGIYVMYMASVGRAGDEMFGIGAFFVIVAGFLTYHQIKTIITSLKGE